MELETINILIPTYNNGHLISDCLESVVNQTYKNIHVIILDDASTDNTKEIVSKFENKIKISYYRNDINLGRGGSRNKILSLSDSRISCWLDSDDYMHPEKIEKQHEYFIDNKDCNFLATPMYQKISDNHCVEGSSTYEKIKSVTLENLKTCNHIPHPTIMFITNTAKKFGFNTSLNREEDWDFYLRIYSEGYRVDVIPNILYFYGGKCLNV